MLSSMGVNIILTMTNRASYGLMAANSAMRAFSHTAANAAQRITQFNLAARSALVTASSWAMGVSAVGAMMTKAAKAAGDYQAQLTQIQFTVLGDEKAFGKIKEAIDAVSASTEFNKTVLAKGARELSQAGLGITEITKAMPVLADLMTISGDSVESTSSLMVQFMKGFKVSADNIEDTFNRLFVVARETPASFKFLTTNMRYVSRVSGIMNKDLTDTAIILGSLAPQQSVRGMAGRGLSQFVERMYNIPKKAQKLMAKHGIKLDIEDTEGNILPLTKILPAISRQISSLKSAKLRGELTTGLFGMQGGALAALNELASIRGAEGLEAVSQRIEKLIAANTYTLHDAAVARRKDYDKQVETLKKDWANLQITLGMTFIPVLKSLTTAFGDFFRTLEDMNAATGGGFFTSITNFLEFAAKYGSLLLGWKAATAGVNLLRGGGAQLAQKFSGTMWGAPLGEGYFAQRKNIRSMERQLVPLLGEQERYVAQQNKLAALDVAKRHYQVAMQETKFLEQKNIEIEKDIKTQRAARAMGVITTNEYLNAERKYTAERIAHTAAVARNRAQVQSAIKTFHKAHLNAAIIGPAITSRANEINDLQKSIESEKRRFLPTGVGGYVEGIAAALQAAAITFTVATLVVDTIEAKQLNDRSQRGETRKTISGAIRQATLTGDVAASLSSVKHQYAKETVVSVLEGASGIRKQLQDKEGTAAYDALYKEAAAKLAFKLMRENAGKLGKLGLDDTDLLNYLLAAQESGITGKRTSVNDPYEDRHLRKLGALESGWGDKEKYEATQEVTWSEAARGRLGYWEWIWRFADMVNYALKENRKEGEKLSTMAVTGFNPVINLMIDGDTIASYVVNLLEGGGTMMSSPKE